MSRIAIVFGLCAAALSGSAWAAPRVGVVVVSHEGLTEAQADEVAYDVAAAVAQRIDGDAIAGGTVRGLLPKDMPEGCHDQPACGRKLGGTIKTDEVLFLIIKRVGKKDLDLTLQRVARDPERIPSDAQLRLTGAKAKRDKAVADTVASIYPPGSVVPYVEAPPPPDPVEVEAVERKHKTEAADAEAAEASRKRGKWLWPVVAVGGALVIGGIIAITIVETRPGPTGSPITLP